MAAIRSLAVFSALYGACSLGGVVRFTLPGVTALAYLLAGFLVGFPADRLYAFWTWASESLRRVKTYRTCVISTPHLVAEQQTWHFIGHIRHHR